MAIYNITHLYNMPNAKTSLYFCNDNNLCVKLICEKALDPLSPLESLREMVKFHLSSGVNV